MKKQVIVMHVSHQPSSGAQLMLFGLAAKKEKKAETQLKSVSCLDIWSFIWSGLFFYNYGKIWAPVVCLWSLNKSIAGNR